MSLNMAVYYTFKEVPKNNLNFRTNNDQKLSAQLKEKATLLDIDNRITSKQKSLNDFLGHSCYGSE